MEKVKDWKIRAYPYLGDVAIYLRHNEKMGRCIFKDWAGKEIVVPNMPKLQYALDLGTYIGANEITERPEIIDKEAYVFEKIDGFNLLFWFMTGYDNDILIFPKTRMKPYPTGNIVKIITDPVFPLRRIQQFIRETRVVPVFEVWGKVLQEKNIFHGLVNYNKRTPYLELVLIGLIEPNTLRFIHPSYTINWAVQYGFRTSYLDRVHIRKGTVSRYMRWLEAHNIKQGYVDKEGVVFHIWDEELQNVTMYKVKPVTILNYDLNRGITEERVLRELSKIGMEYGTVEMGKRFPEIVDMATSYLEEETPKLRKADKKRIAAIIARNIAQDLVKMGYTTPEKAGRMGIHKFVIHFIITGNKKNK